MDHRAAAALTDRRPLRSVRLSEERVAELMRRLDAAQAGPSSLRAHPRYAFRTARCVVSLQQPGSCNFLRYEVPTRDLSASGMCFLHGGYLHPGTCCHAELIGLHGTWSNVVGTVVRCAYVEEGVHDVGVRFLSPILPEEFCREAFPVSVLLVEDYPTTAKLVEKLLERGNATVRLAVNGREALDLTATERFDAILMDLDMPVMDGLEAIRQIRGLGYQGRIIALTGLDRPEDRSRSLQAGADAHINKPVSPGELDRVLADLKREPLFSSLVCDEDMAELISGFVGGLPKLLRGVEQAFVAHQREGFALRLRQLKAQAAMFGFMPLSRQADTIEQLATGGGPEPVLHAAMRELGELCRLTRKPQRSSRAKPAAPAEVPR